jgi:hypothetical protein
MTDYTLPMMGLDADQDVTPYLSAMKAGGLSFFMGYLKILTKPMVAAAHAQGFCVGLIFEGQADNALKGATQGKIDGQRALDQATTLGVPANNTIATYAAIDKSVTKIDLPVLEDYFAAFDAEIFGKLVQGGYADGTAADDLRAHGLPDEWLPGAMGWSGSKAFLTHETPALIQGPTIDGGEWPTGSTLTSLKLPKSLMWPKLNFQYDPDLCLVPPSQAGLWLP